MNKINISVFIILLFLLRQEAKAQGIDYVVENLKGKTEFKKNETSEWERAYNSQILYGTYLLKVEKSVDLKRGGEIRHIARITSPASVDSAWVHLYSKIQKIPSPDVIPMGEEKDSIGFCFITTEGDWRIDGHIFVTDSLEAIAVNHNNVIDTLYASGYWVFPDSTCYPLSNYTPDSIYVVLPKQDNIITFGEPIPVTREEGSSIVFFFSRQEFNYSELDGIPIEELKKNRSYIEFKIQCYHE